jgi:hypothetical protein
MAAGNLFGFPGNAARRNAIQFFERAERVPVVSPHKLFLAVSCSLLAFVCAGCAGSRPGSKTTVAARAGAPDDAAMHVNPNAPYITPGGTPRLVPRATATDVQNAQPCDPDVLSVEEVSANMNGNYRSVKLAFMNRGGVPCLLGGYPTVSLRNSEGTFIGSVAIEKVSPEKVDAELSQTPPASGSDAQPMPHVTLMPHQVAAFQVAWSTGAGCPIASHILLSAPGSRRLFSIPQPMAVCAGRIQVTELRLDEGNV